MTRFKRNRSYATVKAKDETDPKWAGRYVTQNFELAHLVRVLGIDPARLLENVGLEMQAYKVPANKAFLRVLDDALGELQRMKFRAQHDPDLTDYDESHYTNLELADAIVKANETIPPARLRPFAQLEMANGANGSSTLMGPISKGTTQGANPQVVNLARSPFPDGCLMLQPGIDQRLASGLSGCRLPDGLIKHHPDCPIEPTENADAVCSECESIATTLCKRCDNPVCDDCFVHYHFSGGKHEIG